METCSICQSDYSGFGNNAWPVNDGRCCDLCNMNTVIPVRLGIMVEAPVAAPRAVAAPKPKGRARLTYSRSEPWHSGWRGWSNTVDVFLDGSKIGTLDATDQSNKSMMEYVFSRDLLVDTKHDYYVREFGLRKAQAKLAKEVAEKRGV